MIGLARRFGNRLAMMVGGEAAQSAVHFVLNIGLLHALPAKAYGVFALVMVMGGLGLTYVRALSAMPASVWIGRSRTRRAADAYDVSFGSGACLLAVMMALLVALVLEGWDETAAPEAAAFVGLWSLRSYIRIAMSARRDPRPVAVGDAVFTICGMGLSLALLMAWRSDLQQGAFGLLCIANTAAIVAMLLARGQRVRISLRRSVRRRYARIGRTLGWSGIGVTTSNLQGQGLALIVAAMAGPAAYAPIAATLVLFVPLRITAAGLVNIIQPDLAGALMRGDRARAWSAGLSWTGLLGGGGLVYGMIVMAALPFIPGRAIHGVSAPTTMVIAVLAWFISIASLLYVMPRLILEALGDLRTITMISSASAVLVIVSSAVIITIASPAWSLLGGLASELTVGLGLWIALRRRFACSHAGLRHGWLAGDDR